MNMQVPESLAVAMATRAPAAFILWSLVTGGKVFKE